MRPQKYFPTSFVLASTVFSFSVVLAQGPAVDSTVLKKESRPLAADTAQQKETQKDNRNLFQKLFGAKAVETKKDSLAKVQAEEEFARVGKAINHPDRSPKAIHDVVYTYLEAIRHCYLRRLNINPDLRGDILITFTITWEGTVQDVAIVRSTIDDNNLQGCVVGRIRMWKFKTITQEAGDVTVAYPFRFYP